MSEKFKPNWSDPKTSNNLLSYGNLPNQGTVMDGLRLPNTKLLQVAADTVFVTGMAIGGPADAEPVQIHELPPASPGHTDFTNLQMPSVEAVSKLLTFDNVTESPPEHTLFMKEPPRSEHTLYRATPTPSEAAAPPFGPIPEEPSPPEQISQNIVVRLPRFPLQEIPYLTGGPHNFRYPNGFPTENILTPEIDLATRFVASCPEIIRIPGDGNVVAPADGAITVVGSKDPSDPNHSIIKMDIGDGIELVFTHVEPVKLKPGQKIIAGKKIGTISCGAPPGGHTDGKHLDFSLSKDGAPVDIRQVEIAGWLISGNRNYQGEMRKGGQVRTADTGRGARNYLGEYTLIRNPATAQTGQNGTYPSPNFDRPGESDTSARLRDKHANPSKAKTPAPIRVPAPTPKPKGTPTPTPTTIVRQITVPRQRESIPTRSATPALRPSPTIEVRTSTPALHTPVATKTPDSSSPTATQTVLATRTPDRPSPTAPTTTPETPTRTLAPSATTTPRQTEATSPTEKYLGKGWEKYTSRNSPYEIYYYYGESGAGVGKDGWEVVEDEFGGSIDTIVHDIDSDRYIDISISSEKLKTPMSQEEYTKKVREKINTLSVMPKDKRPANINLREGSKTRIGKYMADEIVFDVPYSGYVDNSDESTIVFPGISIFAPTGPVGSDITISEFVFVDEKGRGWRIGIRPRQFINDEVVTKTFASFRVMD